MIDKEIRKMQDEWVQEAIEELERRGAVISKKDVKHSHVMDVTIQLRVPAGNLERDE